MLYVLAGSYANTRAIFSGVCGIEACINRDVTRQGTPAHPYPCVLM